MGYPRLSQYNPDAMSNKWDISQRQPPAEKRVRMHSAEHILRCTYKLNSRCYNVRELP